MPSYLDRREQAASAPQVEILPHEFIGQYAATLAAGGSDYIKQSSQVGATSPTSDEWIVAPKSVLSWFLFTTGPRGLSLVIEISPEESATFYPWKAPFLILRNVPNTMRKLELPASKVKFKLINASTTADAITKGWLKIQGIA